MKKALIVLVLAVLVGGGGWYFFVRDKNSSSPQTSNNNSQQSNTTKDPYASWKTTCDEIIKACYKHPADWIADQYNIGLMNPNQTAYVSLAGPTIKDGGSGSAYIVSIDDLETPVADLKIVGTVINNQPSYSVYNTSYLTSYDVKVGTTREIAYVNYRFNGETGKAAFSGTPGSKGYDSIKTFDQATAWFKSIEAQTCLRILQSFYYQ